MTRRFRSFSEHQYYIEILEPLQKRFPFAKFYSSIDGQRHGEVYIYASWLGSTFHAIYLPPSTHDVTDAFGARTGALKETKAGWYEGEDYQSWGSDFFESGEELFLKYFISYVKTFGAELEGVRIVRELDPSYTTPGRYQRCKERLSALWDAINEYVVICGGDTSNLNLSEERMLAVSKVEKTLDALERDAVDSFIPGSSKVEEVIGA